MSGNPETSEKITARKALPQTRHVDTEAEVKVCYELMRQLRPQLASAQDFVERWRRQATEGYRLLAIWQQSKPVAIAGYRVQNSLMHGKHLYVDDLVTEETHRSRGFGSVLMERLTAEGRTCGCGKLVLDTALANTLAHRFYYRQGLLATALRFNVPIV